MEFRKQFGYLKLYLGTVLFFSMFLAAFGFVSYYHTGYWIFNQLGIVSIFVNIVWVFGIVAIIRYALMIWLILNLWSIFRVEGDLKRIYHSNLTDTMGFEMLIIFFNLTGIIMAGYVTIGIALQLNMKSSLAELEAMSHSPKNWNIRFYKDMPLDSQSQIVQGFY